ncbi:MBL fold metallo-hydrolase [Glutamicibacter sp. AOP12-B1-11]|uniref:MBL fold metallo-hydrolase n=1 Tax=Glutamicibacter sp. AOP12-B1-11 TaxID=3457725 RepID=UPI004034BCB1
MSELLLADVTIRSVSVSEMNNNVYLVTERASGKQLLIDAADETPAILELVASAAKDGPEPEVVGIATTHEHWDHVRALAEVVERFAVPTYAGAEDINGIAKESGVKISHGLTHGDRVSVGKVELEAIHLRGHTAGSIAYALQDSSGQQVIFSGDSLFPGGVGNTWEDPERFESLLNDVSERIFEKFPDDTVVLPGHGGSTTVGTERPHLGEWRQRGW